MLEVQHLRKTFDKLVAVEDVSFKVEPGTITGMIGRNGSGKTTIFRMVLDFLTPEGGGKVLWNGRSLNKHMYNVVGYLPEERGLYEKITVEQQIYYFGRLRGMDDRTLSHDLDVWMERFEVKGNRKDKIKTLSKGNQQKIQLIATLIHRPQLVILDEPFSGLDPVNADLLMKGILDLRDQGSCIIFSSHNMNNVEELCDNLIMVHNGVQLLSGTVQDVRESFGRTRIFVEAPGWDAEKLAAVPGVNHVVRQKGARFLLIIDDPSLGSDIFQAITQGRYIPMFSQQPPTLEEIFKEKAGGNHDE